MIPPKSYEKIYIIFCVGFAKEDVIKFWKVVDRILDTENPEFSQVPFSMNMAVSCLVLF